MATKSKNKETTRVVLTINDAANMNDTLRKDAALWLRRQATALLKHNKKYSKKFVTRFITV